MGGLKIKTNLEKKRTSVKKHGSLLRARRGNAGRGRVALHLLERFTVWRGVCGCRVRERGVWWLRRPESLFDFSTATIDTFNFLLEGKQFIFIIFHEFQPAGLKWNFLG